MALLFVTELFSRSFWVYFGAVRRHFYRDANSINVESSKINIVGIVFGTGVLGSFGLHKESLLSQAFHDLRKSQGTSRSLSCN